MTRRLLLLTSICAVVSVTALAQDRGQVGISLKAQFFPHVGVHWQATERISLRASTFIQGGGENAVDFLHSFLISVYPSYAWRIDESLSTYLGPELTYSKFAEEWYLGAIWGARYQLHERFGAFGEFGLSFDLGDNVESMQMFNTGAGIVFYLNR